MLLRLCQWLQLQPEAGTTAKAAQALWQPQQKT